MAYDLVYIQNAREVGRAPVTGKLREAMATAEGLVDSGEHERVEIRDEENKLVFHHPRVRFGIHD